MESLSIQVQPFVAWLLRSTLQASMLIGLILLVQITLRSKLGPRWSHTLWVLLLLRMVLPWTPQSRASIFNLIPRSFPQIQTEYAPAQPANESFKSPVADKKTTPAFAGAGSASAQAEVTSVGASDVLEVSSQPTTTVAQPGPAEARQAKSAFVRAANLLPLAWLAGALVLGIYICANNFSLLRIVRRERPLTEQKILDLLEDCKAEMGIRTILGVVATDKVKSACLFGFVRPRLLLPKGMIEALNREELRYVFLHELGHLKRHDIWLGWLTSILQALHWFNPLICLAFYHMRADRELACDALVLARLTSPVPAERGPSGGLARTQVDESRNYGRTIVSLLERFSRPQVLPALAGILETKAQLKRRIKMIARSKKTSPVQRAAAVLIFAVLAGVGLTDAYPAPPPFEFGTPVNLGPNVNTSSDDGGSRISADGLSLYFHSDRPGGYGGYDLYVATRESTEDEWGPAVNLGPRLNSWYDECMPGISADGLTLYFGSDRPGGYGNCDLWVTKRTTRNDAWGPPVNLGATVNSSSNDYQPNVSSDGLSLYFASNRPGGYGSFDLWVTTRATLSDPWGPGVNLGPTVNSSSSEYQPSISADGLSLFFEFGRPGGLGPDDIWVTTRATVSDPWGTPVNLGSQVNTSGDDGNPDISADGSTLYFTSNRPGGYGSYDIWQAPILSAPTCGDSEHPYPAVDLNKDCRVDLADLAVLLAHWLECTAPECD